MIINCFPGVSPKTLLSSMGSYALASHTHTGVYQPAGNYLTAEKDPTVPSWAKAASKPTYTASEVGAAPASHGHTLASLGIQYSATQPTVVNGGIWLQPIE